MALWSLAARAGIPAARTALRFLSKLKKPPKSVTLFRGEPAVKWMSAKETGKHMYGPGSGGLFTKPSTLKEGAVGRWFSDEPKFASRFAGRRVFDWHPRAWKKMWEVGGPKNFGYQRGVVKKLKLTPKELKLAGRLAGKVSGSGGAIPGYYVVPKHTLPRVEKDAIRTAIANMRNMMGLKKGGLAQVLNV